MCQLGVSIEGSVLDRADCGAAQRARSARPRPFQAALLAVGRMVLAGRRPRRRHPLLSGASAARTAGARAHARGRRRHARMVPADPAPRSRDMRSTTPTSCGSGVDGSRSSGRPYKAYPQFYDAQAVQQELRPAPGQLVRAEPSRRRLRRDVCGVAHARPEWRERYVGLAGAEEARIHGRADEGHRRQADAGATRVGTVDPLPKIAQDAARALRAQAPSLRVDHPDFYDRDLRRLFSDDPAYHHEHESRAVHRPRAPRHPSHGGRAGPASTSTRSTRCSSRC